MIYPHENPHRNWIADEEYLKKRPQHLLDGETIIVEKILKIDIYMI